MSLLGAALVLMAAQAAAVPPSAAQPSAEAMELARTISRNGLIATMLPTSDAAEVEEIIADNPELSPTEQSRLRAIGQTEARARLDRFIEADAAAHAANLSVQDLREIAAFSSSPAARRLRVAMPAIVEGVNAVLGDDEHSDRVLAAFCAETGKLCD